MGKHITYHFKRGLVFGLLGLIGLLTINNALFIHTHFFLNGQTKTHAHPFNSNDNHSHTQGELFFLSNLMLLFMLIAYTNSKRNYFDPTKLQIFNYLIPEKYQSGVVTNRAPPY